MNEYEKAHIKIEGVGYVKCKFANNMLNKSDEKAVYFERKLNSRNADVIALESELEQLKAQVMPEDKDIGKITRKVNEQVKEIRVCIDRGFDKKWAVKALDDLSGFIDTLSDLHK